MTVSITWSLTAGGAAISSTLDHGSAANGAETTADELFVSHDGSNSITAVAIYARQFSGTYAGSFTAVSDFNEIIGWGDEATENAFGGFMVNFNSATSYATGWPTYDTKTPTGGFAHRSGVGDSEGNAVTVPVVTGIATAGEIANGEEASFQVKFEVPVDEDTIGIRQIESVIRYTYTS